MYLVEAKPSPEDAVLERVPNSQSDIDYVVRFVAPVPRPVLAQWYGEGRITDADITMLGDRLLSR